MSLLIRIQTVQDILMAFLRENVYKLKYNSRQKNAQVPGYRRMQEILFYYEFGLTYEGCSKNNVTCIGARFLFILTCSALQNTLGQSGHTILAGQSIFYTLQWGHPPDTDKQQIQEYFWNCIWKEKIVAGGGKSGEYGGCGRTVTFSDTKNQSQYVPCERVHYHAKVGYT